MSFDFSTLVTDRTQADVNRVKQIAEKIKNGTASESELSEFNSAAMKGAYNYTDLNRVTAAMEALKAKLEGYGYAVPGYQRIQVPHVLPEPEPTSRLPEGYTELTYIESTGTQYVNTGVAGGMPLKVEMVLETTTGTSSVDKMVFASYDGTNNTIPVYWYKGTWFTEVDKTTGQSAGGTLADNTRYNVVFDATSAKYSLVVNGSTLVEKTGSLTGSTKPLFLFARNNNGTASHHATAKAYGLKMYSNNVLVRDYVPCINPDGAVGLYDLVTATFFGNSGTGSFVAGTIPRKLPDGYTQVEYIQSSGTQYVDTNYIPASENLKIYAKSAISKIQSWKSMFGSENGANGPWSLIAITNDSSKLVFYTGTSAMVGSIPVSAGQVYELTCQTANGILTYNCGSTTGSVAVSGSVNKAQTLYVFTQHSHSASNTANQAISMKLYDCKIYDNGTLVRDFVPCKDSSGVYGLCDMVNAKFYGNAGTGAFAAGEEIAPPADVPIVEEYDPHLWYEFDWPTTETMTVYLLNVSAIRSMLAVMKSTPSVPVDMVGLMVQEANNIEKILVDVNELLEKSALVWFYSGDLFAGEVD